MRYFEPRICARRGVSAAKQLRSRPDRRTARLAKPHAKQPPNSTETPRRRSHTPRSRQENNSVQPPKSARAERASDARSSVLVVHASRSVCANHSRARTRAAEAPPSNQPSLSGALASTLLYDAPACPYSKAMQTPPGEVGPNPRRAPLAKPHGNHKKSTEPADARSSVLVVEPSCSVCANHSRARTQAAEAPRSNQRSLSGEPGKCTCLRPAPSPRVPDSDAEG